MPRDHLSNVQSPLDFQVLGIRTRQLSSWQPYRGPPARNQVAPAISTSRFGFWPQG